MGQPSFYLKILERVVVKQLTDNLLINGLFEEFQSGFSIHHSIDAVVKVMNNPLMDYLTMDSSLLSCNAVLLAGFGLNMQDSGQVET